MVLFDIKIFSLDKMMILINIFLCSVIQLTTLNHFCFWRNAWGV